MKRLIVFLFGLTIVSLIGCNDRSSSLLTDSHPSTPSLATANSITIEVPGLTKDNVREFMREKGTEGWDGVVIEFQNDGPAIATLEKVVIWDGVSPIENGVLYQFNSFESVEKAFADRPEIFSRILKGKENISNAEKSKDVSAPELAVGEWYAHAFVYQVSPDLIEAYGATGNPSGPGYKSHQHYSDNGVIYRTKIYNFDDYANHNESWAHYWGCPNTLWTWGWVTKNTETMAFDADTGWCYF